MLFRARYPLMALAIVLVFVIVGVFIGWLQSRPDASQTKASGGPVIAEFTLLDHEGKKVVKLDVLGRPSLWFFGFTNCPDVCPTMLASLSVVLSKGKFEKDQIGVYFVSVDPERDTPAVLKTYLASFDARIRGITGDPTEIGKLAKSLGIYHAKVDTGGGAYSVDHSALVVQLDSRGEFFGTIAYDEAQEAAIAKVRRLVLEGNR